MDPQLVQLGKDLGLTGEPLLAFLREERKEQLAREERKDREQIAREERREAREEKQLELEILEKKIALEQAKQANDGLDVSNSENIIRHSLIKAPKLPNFNDSKDNMDAYLERFERYAKSLGWDPEIWAISLGALLQGKALEVYSRLSSDDASDYNKLKDSLLKRFQLSAEDFARKFRTSVPETGETASQFASRLEHCLERWIDLTGSEKSFEGLKDLIVRQQFLDQVSPGLSIFLKERISSCQSVKGMVEMADVYVSAHGGHFKGSRKEPRQGNNRKFETSVDKVQQKSDAKKEIGPCYQCKQMGHLARNCHAKVRNVQKAAGLVSVEPKQSHYKKTGKTGRKNMGMKNDSTGEGSSDECFSCFPSQDSTDKADVVQGGFFFSSSIIGDNWQPKSTRKRKTNVLPKMCAACKTKLFSHMPVKDGLVGTTKVSVLRDSGCSGAVIRKGLVTNKQMTGRYKWCILIDGSVHRYPTAVVNINSPFYVGEVEALCVDTPVFDVILGNIKNVRSPDNPDPEWGLPELEEGVETGMAVETRAQAKEASRPPRILKTPSTVPNVSPSDMKEAQMSDPTLRKVRELAGSHDTDPDGERNSHFIIENDLLYRVFVPKSVVHGNSVVQLVVPKSYRTTVMKLAHEGIMGGHQGVKKTTDKVLSNFYWPGVGADVTRFVQSCDICQRTIPKGRVPRVPLGKMPIIDIPFKRIAVDLVGPIHPVTAQKNRYILTIVDCATRYPEAVALPNIETTTVAEALVQVFSRVGVPLEILSDQGAQFTSSLMKEIGRLLSIRQLTTTPYHPSCNGLVERFNGSLKQMLRKVCASRPSDWDRYLAPVLFAYREAPQASTGFSPFELLYGRTVRGPLMILKELWTGKQQDEDLKTTYQYVVDLRERLETTLDVAQEELRRSNARYAKYYNCKSKDRKFQPGDKVLLLLPTDSNKLLVQWKGPFTIAHKLSDQDYRVEIKGKMKTFHANLLKRYIEREDAGPQDEDNANSVLEMASVASVIQDESNQDEKSTGKLSGVKIELPALEATETVKDVRVCGNLSSERQKQVSKLLDSFEDVLTDLPGKCNIGSHQIKLTSDDPVRQNPYPAPHALRSVIEEETAKMLEMGVIEPSDSPYASPIVIVKKSDGSNRFCIDFRRLNRVTVFDAEPIPNQDEIFSELSGSKYFSKVDLAKGYWQIPLAGDAKEKTAFRSPSGLYQFRVMPFGLVNAPATFSRLMRSLLKGIPQVHNYLDDILIHTPTWDEHIDVLQEVFTRLREAGLTARPSKCHIGCKRIEFLGHIVREGKIQPMQDKIEKICKAPLPGTKKQMRSFIGMASYYRKFIPQFASIAAALTEKTKGHQPNKLAWTEEDKKAFEKLKDCLSTAPILCLPNLSLPFTVRTDASATGLGAVLLQSRDGVKSPVAYASRKLLPREQRYSTIERECLALVWGIGKFQVYLEGREFILETDHKPLVYINQSKCINNRIMRWALSLQPFRFRIEAIPGAENVGADFLSRVYTE